METITDSGKLKEIFKQAIIEVMEETKDMVHDLLVDAIPGHYPRYSTGGKDRISKPDSGVWPNA